MPRTPPNRPPTITPTSPIISVLRVPKMTRLRMSRPVLSVPNQCAALGRLHYLGEIGEVGIVGRDPRREQRRQHDRGEQQRGGRGHPVAR